MPFFVVIVIGCFPCSVYVSVTSASVSGVYLFCLFVLSVAMSVLLVLLSVSSVSNIPLGVSAVGSSVPNLPSCAVSVDSS
jgi:hypothetical protein